MPDPPDLDLRFSRGRVEYVARLGPVDWLRGCGWTEQDAVEALARLLFKRPDAIPFGTEHTMSSVTTWLLCSDVVALANTNRAGFRAALSRHGHSAQ